MSGKAIAFMLAAGVAALAVTYELTAGVPYLLPWDLAYSRARWATGDPGRRARMIPGLRQVLSGKTRAQVIAELGAPDYESDFCAYVLSDAESNLANRTGPVLYVWFQDDQVTSSDLRGIAPAEVVAAAPYSIDAWKNADRSLRVGMAKTLAGEGRLNGRTRGAVEAELGHCDDVYRNLQYRPNDGPSVHVLLDESGRVKEVGRGS